MGFKESIGKFDRGIKRLFQSNGQREMQYEALFEKDLQYLASDTYIIAEKIRADYALRKGRKIRSHRIEMPHWEMQQFNKIHSDTDISINKLIDDDIENIVNKMLTYIEDPNRRTRIKQNALTSAILYWEGVLRLPDQAYDTVILGKQRIKEISTQIEGFENQDKL